MTARLSQLQTWFQHQLTSLGDAESWSIEAVIEPSVLRTPAERLSVYQNAYVARLVECLEAEFPAVRHAVGGDAFFEFAVAHLQRHPPRSYTLANLGADFAETLASARPPRESAAPDFADFLVDLARYERIVNEVFDAEGPEDSAALDAETLQALPRESLLQSGLEFYPSVRLMELSFPVHEYVTAVRQEGEPTPGSPRDVQLVIHRRDYVVRRWEVTAWQFAVLKSLQTGETIANALLATLTQGLLADHQTDEMFNAFADWGRAKLFRRVAYTTRHSLRQ